jgi:hypothetical protein
MLRHKTQQSISVTSSGLELALDIHDKFVSKGQQPRRAEEKRVNEIRLGRSVRVTASRRCFCSIQNQTSICCISPNGLQRRLSMCSPASLETNRSEPRELALRYPVGLTTRLGRPRAEEIRLIFSAPCYAAVRFLLPLSGSLLAAIDGNQVRHVVAGNLSICSTLI